MTGLNLLHQNTLNQVKCTDDIKTHKINNPVRVTTTGFSTAADFLSIFKENKLYKLAENLPSQTKIQTIR